MPELSPRVLRKASALFESGHGDAVEILSRLDCGQQSTERIHAAVLAISRGDWSRFEQAVELARSDWRDALVGAGFGDDDWPERVAAFLDSA